jgi:regulator of sigma E protease
LIEAPGFLLTILAFVAVIGPLVFVHEMGHYLAGRWFGIHAEAFAIGFGHRIAGFTDKRGTRWQIGWLPLGGYVRFAGDMNPASQPSAEWLALPPAERNRTFQAKPVWQRAIVVAAGPVVNFAVAILVLAGFAMAYGVDRTPATAGAIVNDSAAAAAGIKAGDRIVAIDGRIMDDFGEVYDFVRLRPAERVTVNIVRGDQRLAVRALIAVERQRDRFGNEYRIGRLGISPPPAIRVPVNAIDAPWEGIKGVGSVLRSTTDALAQIISGRRSVKELGGPLQIAKVSGEQLSLGWPAFIGLLALVSINLGFINLMPVPMLDGGHLLFYAIEAVRRRPLEPHVQDWAFRGGMAALLALMLLVTFNDLGAFGLWQGLAGLIG